MSKNVTKSMLLATRAIKPAEIEGLGTVYVQAFPASVAFEGATDGFATGLLYLRALVDEKGERLFADEDLEEALGSIDHKVFKRIIEAVNTLNGIGELEETEKN